MIRSLSRLAASLLLVIALAFPAPAAGAQRTEVTWAKYVSADRGFSFHYPSGWRVQEGESAVMVIAPDGEEQLCLFQLPYYSDWGPEEHARLMVAALGEDSPGFEASGWETDAAAGMSSFELTYGDGVSGYLGMGLVVMDRRAEQSMWFHYLCNAGRLARDYPDGWGWNLLEDFVTSLADGAGSQRPGRVAANADSFLFVLGFALGSPLSMSEEELILDQLEQSWSQLPESELSAYDDYPRVAAIITQIGDQSQLSEVQQLLRATVQEWLEDSDPTDHVVKLIAERVMGADVVLRAGPPDLTEVAATSYAELMAYAELLASARGAEPADVNAADVREIREQLVQAWASFNPAQRDQVLTTPAVWTALRRSVARGSADDRATALNLIAGLAPYAATQASSASAPMNMAARSAMLMVQQKTFDHWMWCMGYRRTPFGF